MLYPSTTLLRKQSEYPRNLGITGEVLEPTFQRYQGMTVVTKFARTVAYLHILSSVTSTKLVWLNIYAISRSI